MNKNLRLGRCGIPFVLIILLGFAVCSQAQDLTLWGNLEAGQYQVGFNSFEKYDYSRAYRAKYDYTGNLIPGEKARPIQICVWYPAITGETTYPMAYSDYLYAYPVDESFVGLLGQFHQRELTNIANMTQTSIDFAIEMMGKDLRAVKDAEAIAGSFPLIIYYPNSESSFCDNAVLCEYLASYGYIVATTQPLGCTSLNPAFDQISLETVTRDGEFVLGFMHDFPNIDPDKTGILGCGGGGTAAMLMKMRNLNIDGIATIGGSLTLSLLADLIKGSSAYSPNRLAGMLMNLYPTSEHEIDMSLVDSLIFSQRYSFGFTTLKYPDFSMTRVLLCMVPDSLAVHNETKLEGNTAVAKYLLEFYKASLNADSTSLQFLANNPEDNGYAPGYIAAHFQSAEELPPTTEQFMAMIRARRTEEALDLYDRFNDKYPGMIVVPLGQFNMLGYQLMGAGMMDLSMRVFDIAAKAYPNTANIWDSYADACKASGDTAKAVQCYENVLKNAETDPAVDDNLREVLRTNAETFLNLVNEKQ